MEIIGANPKEPELPWGSDQLMVGKDKGLHFAPLKPSQTDTPIRVKKGGARDRATRARRELGHETINA